MERITVNSLLRTILGEEATLLSQVNFQTLLIANIYPPLGVIIISPLLDSLTGVYGVSEARIGLLMTAYTAPAILFTPIAGYLSDLYGRKTLLVAGLSTFGLAGITLSLTDSFSTAILLRSIQGIGAVGITPIIVMSLGDLYEGDTEVAAQGLRFSSAGVAQSVFPILSGALAGVAWYYPLVLYGLALPSAVIVGLWLEEPTSRKTSIAPKMQLRKRIPRILDTIREPPLAPLIIARTIPPMLWFAYVTYVSVVVSGFSTGTTELAGKLLAITSTTYAVTATQSGRVSARFSGPGIPILGGNVGMGGGLIVFAYSTGEIFAIGAAIFIGVGFGITLTFYRSLINELSPDIDRGSIVSIAETGDRIAATLTPAVIGLAVTYLASEMAAINAVQYVLAVVGLFGAGLGTVSVYVAAKPVDSVVSIDW